MAIVVNSAQSQTNHTVVMTCQIQWNLTNTATTGLGKSDLNGEMAIITGANVHCGIQFRTEQR